MAGERTFGGQRGIRVEAGDVNHSRVYPGGVGTPAFAGPWTKIKTGGALWTRSLWEDRIGSVRTRWTAAAAAVGQEDATQSRAPRPPVPVARGLVTVVSGVGRPLDVVAASVTASHA